jgi:hypothetical protein
MVMPPSHPELAYLAGGGQPALFTAFDGPRHGTRAVLVCGTIGWEFTKNYRREVLLGTRLAAEGFLVARFHYRGQGESGGLFRTLTLASMLADATEVAVRLRARAGGAITAVAGIRLGAFAAASLAASLGGAPLVLWDPVTDGDQYLRELVRVRRVWSATRARQGIPAGEDFAPDGSLGVLGYRLCPELIAQLRGLRLGQVLGPGCRALSLHTGAVPRQARELAARIHDRDGDGACLVPEAVPGRIDWWMKRAVFEPEEDSAVTSALIARTAQWLAAQHPPTGAETTPHASVADTARQGGAVGGRWQAVPGDAARQATPADTARQGGAVEGRWQATPADTARRDAGRPAVVRHTGFGDVRRHVLTVRAGPHRLAGVFAEPARDGAGLAAVVLNCGSYHPTSGPVGLWALLGDQLARAGIASLRIAYRGVADSTGRVDDFHLGQPRTFELDAARGHLDRMGFHRHLLIGGCLGARTVCAAKPAGVAGLGLVSLPFHVESLSQGLDTRSPGRRGASGEPAAGGGAPEPAAGPELAVGPEPAAGRGGRGGRGGHGTADDGLAWLNHSLLADLGRWAGLGVPMRLVYSAGERYRRDFDAASAGSLGATIARAAERFEVTIVSGLDSMLEPEAVAAAVTEFAAARAAAEPPPHPLPPAAPLTS